MRSAVLVVLAAGLALAAPVPKAAESHARKLERLFGTPVQPDGTKLELDGDSLRISLPQFPAGKPGEVGVPRSPRTTRAVTGDFEVTVRVTTPEPAGGQVDVWAGLYVQFGEDTHFDYMRWLNQPVAKFNFQTRGVWSQVRTAGKQSNVVGHKEAPADAATLRIVRKGNQLTAHARYGDKGEWTHEVKATLPLPDEVTVGVYAGGRKGPFVAAFDGFAVTPAGK